MTEYVEIRAALQKLVDKLTEIEADSSFQGIWPYLHVHGYHYTGPNYRDELTNARLELLRSPPELDDVPSPHRGRVHDDYCPLCLGPCCRRPRHGEMNL